MILAPSILSADWSNLDEALLLCHESLVEYLHLDVMDGNFVPPITFGAKFISNIRPKSHLFFDVHLMVQRPEQHIESMISAGADAITFHIEATHFSYRLISHIRDIALHTASKKIKVGIAVNPQTSIEQIAPLLPHIDIVLLMGVEPGYGGQSFIRDVLHKIAYLHALRKTSNNSFLVSIDGGVNKDTAQEILSQGVDVLVMGSAFFNAESPRDLCTYLHELRY